MKSIEPKKMNPRKKILPSRFEINKSLKIHNVKRKKSNKGSEQSN